jgi:7,8-dihydropterin-6-yl-methyl-4-(beta-D-ribofuranosyl)aminobenzene 5'-phosphate synthase
MPLRDTIEAKEYAVRWAFKGLTRPKALATFFRDRQEADREWREWRDSRPGALEGLGSVSHLSVLPLVDFYPGSEALVGEAGVSYLVTAGDKRFLFDTGFNPRQEHPSPLLHNMERLGVSPADIDAVFISHLHLDHVGGPEQAREHTFTLSGQPVELNGIPAYVPTAMDHPSARVQVVSGPRVLAPGVASSGPMTRAIWLMGAIAEQALLVNVAGMGTVMIVGCGHPQLDRLVERAKTVTGTPLHGIIGGLHFPVTRSRVGKGRQIIIGNGKLPWQRITRHEAKQAAAGLADLDLGIVALSAHDSCDWALDSFGATLGDRFRTIKVGEEIMVA